MAKNKKKKKKKNIPNSKNITSSNKNKSYKKNSNNKNKNKTNSNKKSSKKKYDSKYDDLPKAIKDMQKEVDQERKKATTKNNVKTQRKKLKSEKAKAEGKKKITVKKVMLSIFLALIVLGVIACSGAAMIVYNVYENETNINAEDLKIKISNTKIVTADGQTVLAELSGDEKRKIVSLEDMAKYLPKAYVAIEDERFYQHKGVDIKRTAGAILHYVTGNKSYGGSTITQQLVKNLYNDKESSYKRKIREWARAYKIEQIVDDKDKILEQYLNVLFIGGQMHGVELGAEYYFGKTAKELDLAECAYLAGINHSPNSYNPYSGKDNSEAIKKRTKIVLTKMKELNYIESEEEYNEAVAKVDAGLTFTQLPNLGNVYSYHTDAIIDQLTKQLMQERKMTLEQAETYVYGSGLTVYSTVDQNIQQILETEFAKTTLKIPGNDINTQTGQKVNEASQAAMVVLDYRTGEVVGCVGGYGEEKTSRGLNRATQTQRQVGSAMKPISCVAPALQEKIIQTSTVYDDNATSFANGTWEPKNYNYFKGLQSIRQFIETSQNIPAAKIMAELTPSTSIEYLEKLGITSLDETDDAVLSLALGGQHNGVSVLDMATAYGTIANGGLKITPTFYSKVLDADGNEILKPDKTQEQAISAENAYITQQILREPVYGASGTATNCAIPGIETSCKTGTTDDNYDRWLCGMTPYYSAACWFGYDINEQIRYSGRSPASQLWEKVMKQVHQGKPSLNFTRPEGIVEKNVCTLTGQLAGHGCATKVEIFSSDNIPTQCAGHETQKLCAESNLLANPYCPSTVDNVIGTTIPKEENAAKLGLWKALRSSVVSNQRVTQTCTIHSAPAPVVVPSTEKPKEENKNTTNTTTPTTPNTPTTPSTNETDTTTKPGTQTTQ